MSTDANYTNIEESSIGSKAERVGDITGKPPSNVTTDKNKAAKLANLLEGLEFPTTKDKIRNYLVKRSPSMGNSINDILEAVENNLKDRVEYNSAYEIERAAGLVEKANEPRVYDVSDISNKSKTDEPTGKDLYIGHESIRPTNERNVSPNTPTGEEI